jgi:RHS repeat-associated protein
VDGWLFEAERQGWSGQLHSLVDFDRALPRFLAPGQALYLRTETATALEFPDQALRIRYYHQDHLGSSGSMTDAEGGLIQESVFYPFGVTRNEWRFPGIQDPYQFAQKERDRESGLDYLEARYLASTVARFLSVDSKYLHPDALADDALLAFVAQPGYLNLCAYALNNPVRYIDPSGLGPWSWFRENVWIPGVDNLDELDGVRTVKVAAGVALLALPGGQAAGGSLLVATVTTAIAADQISSGIMGTDSLVSQAGTAMCGGNRDCGTVAEIGATLGTGLRMPAGPRAPAPVAPRPTSASSTTVETVSTASGQGPAVAGRVGGRGHSVIAVAQTVPHTAGAIATEAAFQAQISRKMAYVHQRIIETAPQRAAAMDMFNRGYNVKGAGAIIKMIGDEADAIFGVLSR